MPEAARKQVGALDTTLASGDLSVPDRGVAPTDEIWRGAHNGDVKAS